MIIQNIQKGNAKYNKVYFEISKDILLRMGTTLRKTMPKSCYCVTEWGQSVRVRVCEFVIFAYWTWHL